MKKTDIIMPKLGNNDTFVTIVDWYKKNGEFCSTGDEVCMVETTKRSEIVKASCDGYIEHLYEAEEDVRAGSVIAHICEGSIAISKPMEHVAVPYKITNKAKALAAQHNIDLSIFDSNTLIREKDILQLIEASIGFEEEEEEILIFGSGGFCKTVIDIFKRSGQPVKGIIDINYPDIKEVAGIPIIGNINSLKTLYKQGYRKIINTVSLNRRQRARRYAMLKEIGFTLPNVIHERAFIEDSAVIGEGNIIMAGAYVGSHTVIGNNCILNVNSVVSHDCKIGSSVNISSGAVIGGIATIGDRVIIGQCASIYWGLTIGEDALIENGCHVFDNLKSEEEVRNSGIE